MPAKNRVRSDNRGQFHQSLSTQRLACDGQSPSLVIGEPEAFLALRFHDSVQLGSVELNDLLLLTVHPANQNHDEELPGLKNKAHVGPDAEGKTFTIASWTPRIKPYIG